ncbi:cell division transport system permease protein [Flavimobilis soli]|uniref:Cell division protein FtsX n=1 Tax=Flavimobilis soli TaxID=442709 RepID=A0A2A9EBR5_9MICO|nr:permease-like cell division protein FtsX [Flavimobilis soli]PFG36086.1 cell division transport system permease protein [Flavimobilis soli]
MRLQFILSEIGIGLRRNLSMTISVILVTFVSLTFVGAASLLQMQVSKLKDDWYGKVEVTVLLCPTGSSKVQCASGEATPEQVSDLEALIASPELAPEIQEVWFETKEQAFESFQEYFSGQDWAEAIRVEDMQASFRIKLVNPENYQVVSDVLTGRPGVESVEDQRKIFDSLFLVLNRASVLAVGLAAVMLLAAVLLITTTIRLSALSRRRETGIMRLVGASNLFIQLPFMLEGALAAALGAVLAVGGLWLGVKYLVTDWLAGEVSWVPLVGVGEVWTIAPLLLAVAIVLAAISSLVTLNRYTKV